VFEEADARTWSAKAFYQDIPAERRLETSMSATDIGRDHGLSGSGQFIQPTSGLMAFTLRRVGSLSANRPLAGFFNAFGVGAEFTRIIADL
jgi:hypothetical protein